MVRLITHNLLACHVKGCDSNNFPLTFSDAEVEIRESEYNADFLKGFFPKIEWKALVDSARQVRVIGFTWCTAMLTSDILFAIARRRFSPRNTADRLRK